MSVLSISTWKMKECLYEQNIGRYFSRLFSKRSTGDYDDFFNHSIETVDELMPDAKLFIQTIKDWIEMWLKEQSAQ